MFNLCIKYQDIIENRIIWENISIDYEKYNIAQHYPTIVYRLVTHYVAGTYIS